ncbi:MAG: hypothetical protein HIU92_08645 [Proteobacteria bacterium]|nr:hypothetical protein [Pseudomonadota bacterium]
MANTPIIVSSGTTLTGKDVVGSHSIIIEAGATASHLSAGYSAPGGTISVQGIDTGANLFYNGTESILSGGSAMATHITNVGATQIVEAGGVASRTIDGGVQNVESGGTAAFTTIAASAGEVVFAGGAANHTTVDSGGFLVVTPGATIRNTTVETGGSVVSTGIVVDDHNTGFTSDTNAQAKGLMLGGSSTEYVLGSGVAHKTTLTSGGSQLVFSGGTAATTVVTSGGIQTVYSGGQSTSATISAGGTETILAHGSALSTTIGKGGIEIVSGGTADATRIAGGTLELKDGAVTGRGIDFIKPGGTLDIVDSSSMPGTVILEFAKGDKIDFGFLTSSGGDSYSVLNDAVTVSAGGHSYLVEIDGATAGGYTLSAAADGTLVLAVCYYPGTSIRTPTGDVTVEALAIGDDVVTAEGRIMPIRWIGRNTVSTRFADPIRVLPIRIRAGALGDALPERDLLVSPEHAVLVDDILVQAAALVNEVSILRERNVPETFTYYHVELDEHALILAEGTPAESFVDNIHRTAFDNWNEHEALYGRDVPILEMPQPRALSYRQVPVEIHDRLMRRAELMAGGASQQVA